MNIITLVNTNAVGGGAHSLKSVQPKGPNRAASEQPTVKFETLA